MRLFRKTIVTAVFIFICFNSKAWWGLTGHRVVGEIAFTYLSAKAKDAISRILGSETVAMAANWADFIRSDSTNNYLAPWHYMNVDSGVSRTQFFELLKSDTAADAYTKLNFLIKELKNKHLPIDKKRMYLKLLIHIVGDVHQPLHVGRFSDLGGNKIKITWFNEPSNLHSVWDDKLIDFQKLSFSEYAKAINHTQLKQRLEWQKQPVAEWLYESYQLATEIYQEITMADQKLGYRYNYDHLETMNRQLLKGGVRLAGLLNRIFM